MADVTYEAASPGSMSHEDEGADREVLRIFYLLIEESADGFRWQVRGHDLVDPVDVSRRTFESDTDAQEDGRRALDKVCAQFQRYDVSR